MASATNDSNLQLAPRGDAGPDFGTLKDAFTKAATGSQPYVDQCRLNYETRYALWPGQTADGKKHAREGAKIDPTPWDGASDLRVYLTDNIINKKVAMKCMAFHRANLTATPTEGNDIKRANIVGSFMRWLMYTQMPDIDREIELLANYIDEKGVAATGQFWETVQEKTLVTVRMDEFAAKFPNINVQAMIMDETIEDDLASVFEEVYGASSRKARRMIKELRETGTTTVAVVAKEKSRPVLRAFNFDSDLFVAPSTTDAETCAGFYRVQYFTPEKLRSFVNTDGWDEAWVEKAIECCRGQLLTVDADRQQQPQSRSFVYVEKRFSDLIGVVYAYQRLSDEDGVPGIYCTIFSPNLPPDNTQKGYAKFGLLGYAHGEYPFVVHRREYLSRKLLDSRGVPEPGKPWQDQIKAHKDGRIDAASLSIIPPICYPIGRPPSRWGPGARIPERRPNEYHYADRVIPDLNTDDSEDRLTNGFKDYNGMASREGDPQFLPLENQHEVRKFLGGLSRALSQIWKLYVQFGRPEVFFRVVGARSADPMLFKKGDENEEYDFRMTFDVQGMDPDMMEKKLTMMVKAAQLLDRDGNVDYARFLQVAFDAIDPSLAEMILQPTSVGTAKVVADVQDDLAKLFSGISVDVKPTTPPQIAMQVIQQYVQAPDVQQRLASDEAFRKRMEAYAKQTQFQMQQRENAKIGQLGAQMPEPTV